MDTLNEMVDAVIAHAKENYEKDGWDFVIECYTRQDIRAMLHHKGATSNAEAIEEMGKLCKVLAAVRSDIQGA